MIEISDSHLRKISISAMGLVVLRLPDGSLSLNDEMVEFIRAISSKYRIYLLT